MSFHLDETITTLLTHPYFEKAKKVKELGPGHLEDSVYIHLSQTADIVRKSRDGSFIQNKEARNLFQEAMAKQIAGVSYSDIAVVTALVHDIGKILSYQEEGSIFPINQPKPHSDSTISIDHGFYGEIVIRPLLTEVKIDKEIIDYIVNIVRLHLVPVDYYKNAAGYSLTETIDFLKPLMQGHHVEVCLNGFGDIAHNPPLRECWELIGKMFEDPHFYSSREYFVK